MVETRAESPLTNYTELFERRSQAAEVRIAEAPFPTQLTVRVDPESPAAERIGTALGTMLPKQPGDVARTSELAVLWMGPDEWLVVSEQGSPEYLQAVVREAAAGEHASVVDVSANRTVLSVSGSRARELLNKGCALDLHPSRFETDRCAQTKLARSGVILECRDAETPEFRLFVRSSFARYVADWLLDAALEYGGDPV